MPDYAGRKHLPEGIGGRKVASPRKEQQEAFTANVSCVDRDSPPVSGKKLSSRDNIVRGAADLGVDLDEHIQFVIDAMAGIARELGLLP